jgi:parallel beta-helix repeat protein
MADGSISPPTPYITTMDNITFTLVGNITDSIVVQRNDIIVDGNGYALQGSGNGAGFYLSGLSNVTIKNTTITDFNQGIWLNSSSDNTLSSNNAANNNYGIVLESSNNNTLAGNNLTSNSDTANNGEGIELGYSSNNNIFGNNLYSNDYGIAAYYSNDSTLDENNITENGVGIKLAFSSSDNEITRDDIVSNSVGIELSYSSNDNNIVENNVTTNLNSGITVGYKVPESSAGIYYGGCSTAKILKNAITSNGRGIDVICSNHTEIFHNNFEKNDVQAYVDTSQDTHWDDGYPSGGNYWSDYSNVDVKSGPGQDLPGSDGIGDLPYQIEANNTDGYPLMGPFSTFDAGMWNGAACKIDVTSNSTISDFQVDVIQKKVSLNATGPESTSGFCRVTLSNTVVQDLWQGNYQVLLNNGPWPFKNWTDTTNSYIYINYTLSEHGVVITPEYLPLATPALLTILSTLAVVLSRKRKPGKPKTPAQ